MPHSIITLHSVAIVMLMVYETPSFLPKPTIIQAFIYHFQLHYDPSVYNIEAAQESFQVKSLCQKLRTPSDNTKQALSTLFPACSSVSSSRKRKFDPTEGMCCGCSTPKEEG